MKTDKIIQIMEQSNPTRILGLSDTGKVYVLKQKGWELLQESPTKHEKKDN